MDRATFLWRKERLGKFTASKIHTLTTGKTGLLKGAKDWAFEKAVDIYYLRTCDDQTLMQYIERKSFTNRAVQYGQAFEAAARSRYEEMCKVWVDLCQFEHKDDYGCTPDGEVQGNRLIEIKCPYSPSVFVKYMLEVKDNDSLKEVEPKYYWQIQMQMAVTGYNRCDFVAFDPHCDRLHVVPIYTDEKDLCFLMDRIDLAVEQRNEYLQQILAK